MRATFSPRLLAIALLSTGSVFLSQLPSPAQYTPPAEEKPFTANEVDPTKQGLGNGFDPMSLIHNANLSRSRTGADFAEDTQRTLNDAANEFKRQQQQRLQETQSSPTGAIAPATPKPATP